MKTITDLPNEKWKDVIGYDGYYEISNKGRLKCLPRIMHTAKGVECFTKERIKALRQPKKGSTNTICQYSVEGVNIRYNFSKQVALHFIPKYDSKDSLYFIDGNRANCSVDNLIVVNSKNVIKLYDNNTLIPSNVVSELMHQMGYKKCSVCKNIKKLHNFSKASKNRDTNNNCQECVNKLVYAWRNGL